MTYDILDAAGEQSNPFVDKWVHRAVDNAMVHFILHDPNCDTVEQARQMAIELVDGFTDKLDEYFQRKPAPSDPRGGQEEGWR